MNILLWVVQILLGLLFMMSGVMKFIMSYADMSKDAPVVLPYWFILFIGVCEILGAIGLVVPWATGIKRGLTPLAAALLVIIMIGAVVISAQLGAAMAAVPAVAGLLCILVAVGRGRSVKAEAYS
jgi:putative oxidoreductase